MAKQIHDELNEWLAGIFPEQAESEIMSALAQSVTNEKYRKKYKKIKEW